MTFTLQFRVTVIFATILGINFAGLSHHPSPPFLSLSLILMAIIICPDALVKPNNELLLCVLFICLARRHGFASESVLVSRQSSLKFRVSLSYLPLNRSCTQI